ncbi:unnamed protein product [Cuscuta epithymum]|uniref:Uncharacterized protein n=1 Tax=Cuscuta epithymum TaxID=186058 RepID=A0AAV0G5C6_9ASTE|nr:unnamed protein product [Cuscuta epithymum]
MLNHESNEFPLCPKPRRLVSAHPEFLQPLSCSKHSVCKLVSEMNIIDGGRSEVLSIIGDHQKKTHTNVGNAYRILRLGRKSQMERRHGKKVAPVKFVSYGRDSLGKSTA